MPPGEYTLKISYLENLNQTLMDYSRKALRYRDGIAWDNRKKKAHRLHAPRGRVYRRLDTWEWTRIAKELEGLVKSGENYSLHVQGLPE